MAKDDKPKPPIINIDAEPENRDWAKRTWDLDIDNVTDLRAFLDEIGMSVRDFKRLPVYRWNVDQPGMAWLKEL